MTVSLEPSSQTDLLHVLILGSFLLLMVWLLWGASTTPLVVTDSAMQPLLSAGELIVTTEWTKRTVPYGAEDGHQYQLRIPLCGHHTESICQLLTLIGPLFVALLMSVRFLVSRSPFQHLRQALFTCRLLHTWKSLQKYQRARFP